METKPTKRLAFNFLRSYFDVLNKIPNDKDKLAFLLSVINKQFLDEDPKGLDFLANLCYESQKHSIEKSVKGWKTANKTDMQGNPTPPKGSPLPPPIPLPLKEEEEQVQEKEQVQYNNSADVKTSTPSIDFDKLLNFINKHTQREGRSKFKIINQSVKNSYKARLREGYTNEDIGNAIKNAANDPFHKENNYRHLTPKFFSRSDKIDLHGFKTNANKSKISIKDFSSNPYNE